MRSPLPFFPSAGHPVPTVLGRKRFLRLSSQESLGGIGGFSGDGVKPEVGVCVALTFGVLILVGLVGPVVFGCRRLPSHRLSPAAFSSVGFAGCLLIGCRRRTATRLPRV